MPRLGGEILPVPECKESELPPNEPAVAKGDDAATEPVKPAEEPNAPTKVPVEKEEIVAKSGDDTDESATKGE